MKVQMGNSVDETQASGLNRGSRALAIVLSILLAVAMVPLGALAESTGLMGPAGSTGSMERSVVASADEPEAESWYDPTATQLTISTAAELAEFAQIVNGTHETFAQDDFAGKTVTLANDIALADEGLYAAIDDVAFGSASYPMHCTQYVVDADAPRWTPIGSGTATSNTDATTANAFAGTFDGDGKCVSGVYIGDGTATSANTNTVAGLFGVVTGTVKNVEVSGCIAAKIVAGGVVAYLEGGTVENCRNRVIVFADGGTTPNGGVENGLTRGGAIGGVAGNVTDGSTVSGCENFAEIVCANTNKGGRAGGIVGLIDSNTAAVTVTKCANTGNVLAYQYAAGIVGLNFSVAAPITLCSNGGTITGSSSGSTYVGGIASQCFSSVAACYNTGDYGVRAWSGSKASHLGGIVSDLKKSGTTVSNCYDTGRVFYYLNGEPATYITSYGAIIGSGYGYAVASSTEVNCYSDSALACEDADYHNRLTLDEMKSPSFVASLNGETSWFVTDSTDINDGCPVLAWQVGGSSSVVDGDACDTHTSGGRTIHTYAITSNGTYQLAEGLSDVEITIAAEVTDVRFVGNGVVYNADITDDPFNDDKSNLEGYGCVYSTPNNNVSIDASACPSIKITLEDVYISDMTMEANKNFITFGDEAVATLRFEGTNIVDYQCAVYGALGTPDACIRVASMASLTVEGTGTVYGYKWSSGAFIGGNRCEANGELVFDLDADASMFVKGSKQSAIFGAGAATTSSEQAQVPGAITFKSGNYYLVTNAKGAAVGGSAGSNGASKGTLVTVENSAFLSINVDYSGAAIGGGGYVYGNDSSGGTLCYCGGSVRPYMDVNAASNVAIGWQGRAVHSGICDAVITAQRLNQNGETVYFLAIPGGGSSCGSHQVEIDGEVAYSGNSTYRYNFIYNSRNRGAAGNKDTSINVYPRSDIGNWYPEADDNYYVFATGESHEVTCDGRSYYAEFVPVEQTVDVYKTDEDGNTIYETDADGDPIRDDLGNLIPIIIGQETKVTSASYFKLTCTGESHVWEGGACAFCDVPEGDANLNGVLNIVDAQVALDIANGMHAENEHYAEMVNAADVSVGESGEARVDATDARAIQHAVHCGW